MSSRPTPQAAPPSAQLRTAGFQARGAPPKEAGRAQTRSGAIVILALATALVAFNGVRTAGGSVAIADPFLALAMIMALVGGRSLIASPIQRRLLVIAYFFVLASLLSVLAGAPADSDLGNVGRFLLAAIGLPLTVLAIARGIPDVRLLAFTFVLSACIAALAGILDATLGIGIGRSLTTQTSTSEIRFGGLTSHPNHLGIVCAMSLPIVLGLTSRARPREYLLQILALIVLVLAIGVSGSRAALVGAVVGLAMFLVLQHQRLPHLTTLLGVTLVCLSVLFTGGYLASEDFHTPVDRLVEPTASTVGSDAAHAFAQDSARAAFLESPIWGSGFQEIRSGLNVPLQVVASAGVIGLAAFLTLLGTAGQAGIRVLRKSSGVSPNAQTALDRSLAAAFLAAGVAWLVAGISSNAILDRYIYLPLALLLVLGAPYAGDRGHGGLPR